MKAESVLALVKAESVLALVKIESVLAPVRAASVAFLVKAGGSGARGGSVTTIGFLAPRGRIARALGVDSDRGSPKRYQSRR